MENENISVIDYDSVRDEVLSYRFGGQEFVRRRYLAELHELTGNDVISYFGASSLGVEFSSELAAIAVDDVRGFIKSVHELQGEKLDLIIHSPGGSLEGAEQIVSYLREKYKYIRAIIPQNAMSAATMIACACDEIMMGSYSAIGPIDPQIVVHGVSLPAHTILADWENTVRLVKEDANLKFLMRRFMGLPPGFMELCKQAIALSKEKVQEWLQMYMFAGKAGVYAQSTAGWLSDFNEHKTHGRPIGFRLARDKGLKVTRLEDNSKLENLVLAIFHSTVVTCQVTGCVKIIENHKGDSAQLYDQDATD
jgi:hypothetical protein